jgi:hypothetical protein
VDEKKAIFGTKAGQNGTKAGQIGTKAGQIGTKVIHRSM